MTKFFSFAARGLAIALIGAAALVQSPVEASAAGSRASAAQMRAQAAKMKMMQARQGQAAQAGMAAAMVTAATLAATDAGECSPYLAKMMMTKSPAARAAYEACMED